MSGKLYLSPSGGSRGKKNIVDVVKELRCLSYEEASEQIIPMLRKLKKPDFVVVLRALQYPEVRPEASTNELVRIFDSVVKTISKQDLLDQLQIFPPKKEKKTKPVQVNSSVESAFVAEAKQAIHDGFELQKVLSHPSSKIIIMILFNPDTDRMAMVSYDPEEDEIDRTLSDTSRTKMKEWIRSLGEQGFKAAFAFQKSIVSKLV